MLSKKSKYAIKALVSLAKHHQKGHLTRIIEISDEENIPKKFLETILLDLRKHGILASKLGVNGGYYLLKQPKEIFLADIIRFTDGPIALIPCASLNFYQKCEDCNDEVICGLRQVVLRLRDANLKILTGTTIADLVKQENKLSKGKHKK